MTVRLHDTRGVAETLPVRLERKFYLAPEKVELAYGLLRTICRPDRHYPIEEIHSLYFDTPGLDELERSLAGDFRKNKVRIRWYSENGHRDELVTAFIELKSRQGFNSTKQRFKIEVPSPELGHLASGIIPRHRLISTLAGFGFFPVKPILPIITISYLRFRFRDDSTSCSLALDCHIRSISERPDIGYGERELELSGAVLEIKGNELELPVFLKNMQLLDIDWSQFSKYSACLIAQGERCGTVGRLSPSGRNVMEMPVKLREPGHFAAHSCTEQDWNTLFSPSHKLNCLPASPDKTI